MKKYIGIDIGGTKCAITLAKYEQEGSLPIVTNKKVVKTKSIPSPYDMVDRLMELIDDSIKENGERVEEYSSIGISCGNPLDAPNGLILSPPNLPGWDDFPIVDIVKKHYNLPTFLQNDANACALAEYYFGAGIGYKNVVFLTFGSGMGAGLILDSRLYEGTNGNAGEVGHMRIAQTGPIGYHKKGSFEGFCSGGGLKQQGIKVALDYQKKGKNTKLIDYLDDMSAKVIFECAKFGDEGANKVVNDCAKNLGKGLSVIIDIINPEIIIIGSIYERNENILYSKMMKVINKEALDQSVSCCKIVKSKLGDSIGDIAAIAIAHEGINNGK